VRPTWSYGIGFLSEATELRVPRISEKLGLLAMAVAWTLIAAGQFVRGPESGDYVFGVLGLAVAGLALVNYWKARRVIQTR
jgi:hypothetical protein